MWCFPSSFNSMERTSFFFPSNTWLWVSITNYQFIHSLKVRLHPKPQLKIEYICSESFTLFQPTHLRVILTNISLHYYKQIQYPFDSFIWLIDSLISKVVFEKHPDTQCNYEVQQIEELVPHVLLLFFSWLCRHKLLYT